MCKHVFLLKYKVNRWLSECAKIQLVEDQKLTTPCPKKVNSGYTPYIAYWIQSILPFPLRMHYSALYSAQKRSGPRKWYYAASITFCFQLLPFGEGYTTCWFFIHLPLSFFSDFSKRNRDFFCWLEESLSTAILSYPFLAD